MSPNRPHRDTHNFLKCACGVTGLRSCAFGEWVKRSCVLGEWAGAGTRNKKRGVGPCARKCQVTRRAVCSGRAGRSAARGGTWTRGEPMSGGRGGSGRPGPRASLMSAACPYVHAHARTHEHTRIRTYTRRTPQLTPAKSVRAASHSLLETSITLITPTPTSRRRFASPGPARCLFPMPPSPPPARPHSHRPIIPTAGAPVARTLALSRITKPRDH